MNEENNIEQNKLEEIEKGKRSLVKEGLITLFIILVLSTLTILFVTAIGIKNDPNNLIKITYSASKEFVFDKSFAKASLILGAFISILYFLSFAFIKPSGIKPTFGKKLRWLYPLIILGLFGYLAYLVIALFLSGLSISFTVSSFLACLIVGVYDYLIYKMYAEKRTFSNFIFWEIFRFAIVGLVAAVFDFATCFVVQFIFFKGNEAGYVTFIATACGFIIGVIINYLMSTYMVYKAAKSNFSKSFKGMLTFFILSAIGLGIGVGIQYFLYDFLYVSQNIGFFSYPVDFVIRTLIVMVYNYITRKIFIYK